RAPPRGPSSRPGTGRASRRSCPARPSSLPSPVRRREARKSSTRSGGPICDGAHRLFRRFDAGLAPWNPSSPMATGKSELKTIGKPERRVDSVKLATGRGTFVDDIALPGMLHARILHSPHAHARITRIDATQARAMPGVACVLTHHDVPRVAYTTAGQGWPEPSPYDAFMLDNKVRFVGDRVAVVAAEDPELAQRACDAIRVHYQPLPALL